MKAFIISILFIITAQLLYSQQTATGADTIKLITNKWEAVKLNFDRKDIPVQKGRKAWMEFKADGTMVNTDNIEKQVIKGKWQYKSPDGLLMMDETLGIIKLTADSMILRRTEGKMSMLVYLVKSK